MNAEFNWWLLVVGVVAGAGLAWLVLGDWTRTEADLDSRDREIEAVWIADALRGDGHAADPLLVEGVLKLHRDYLVASTPADDWMVEDDGLADLDDDWDESDQAVVDAVDSSWVTTTHRSIRDGGNAVRAAEPADETIEPASTPARASTLTSATNPDGGTASGPTTNADAAATSGATEPRSRTLWGDDADDEVEPGI